MHERLKTTDRTKLTDAILWDAMFKAFKLNSLAGAAMNVKPGMNQEGVLPNGLVMGHAYSLLDAFALIPNSSGKYDSLEKSYAAKAQSNEIRLLK